MSKLLTFPGNQTIQQSSEGARWWQVIGTRLREKLGAALNRRRVPGAIRPMTFSDPVTGDEVRVSVTALFTRLSINGRDYYFNRLSGDFDGTGQGC